MIFLTACLVGAVFRGAYEREEDRSVAFPSVTALPEIFFAVQFDRVKLSTESVGLDREFIIFYFIKHRSDLREKNFIPYYYSTLFGRCQNQVSSEVIRSAGVLAKTFEKT